MTSLLIHILKWALCLAVLYIPFTLLLRKETFASLNRSMLLGIVAVSAMLPLFTVRFTIEKEIEVADATEPVATIVAETNAAQQAAAAATSETEERSDKWQPFTWENAAILYLIGLCTALIWEAIGIARTRQAIRRGTIWCERRNGMTIHCHANDTTPFSWFSHIVISQNDYNECGNEILLHEEGHIRHRHSWDMLFIGLAKTLQWFNPFIYMLSDDIKEIHEYEADRYVLEHHSDAGAYQLLLLKKAAQGKMYPMANNFGRSSVRKRITMMARKRSNLSNCAKWLYLLPMSAACTAIFAQPEYVYIANSAATAQQTMSITAPSPTVTGEENREDTTPPRHIPAGLYTPIPYSNRATPLPSKVAHIDFPVADEGELRYDTFYEYIDIDSSSATEALKATGIHKCDIRVRFTAGIDGRPSNIVTGNCNITAPAGTAPSDISIIKAAAASAATRHIATRQWNTGNRTEYDAYIIYHHGPSSSIQGNLAQHTMMVGSTAIR